MSQHEADTYEADIYVLCDLYDPDRRGIWVRLPKVDVQRLGYGFDAMTVSERKVFLNALLEPVEEEQK